MSTSPAPAANYEFWNDAPLGQKFIPESFVAHLIEKNKDQKTLSFTKAELEGLALFLYPANERAGMWDRETLALNKQLRRKIHEALEGSPSKTVSDK